MEQPYSNEHYKEEENSITLGSKIDETKSSLQEKFHTLKNEVSSTMAAASDNVQETVETIKKSFSLTHHIENHPLAALGISVAIGYLLYSIVDSAKSSESFTKTQSNETDLKPDIKKSYSKISSIAERYAPEMNAIRGLAIGSGLGLLGNVISDVFPSSIRPEVNRIFEDFKAKATGSK